MGGTQFRASRKRVGAAWAVLAAGLLPWLSGCGRLPEPPEAEPLPPVEVKVVMVKEKERSATEETVGVVRAKVRALIEAKISGRVEAVLVAVGTSVRAGDMLVRVDEREIQARLDQAMANLDQAESDLQRLRALLAEQAVTQAEFDAVQARQRVAKAAVAEAETMLSYAKITAPFDGVITRKTVDVGDLAGPGKPLLELEDPAALRLEADVPEALVGRLTLGLQCRVEIPTLGTNLAGTVAEIAPAADLNTHTFRVKFDLGPLVGLRAGQFGRVGIPIEGHRAMRVPAPAVLARGQMELVFVATNRQAELRLVKTGKRVGEELEVLSGVTPGESVVVEGAADLVDGQPLKIVP